MSSRKFHSPFCWERFTIAGGMVGQPDVKRVVFRVGYRAPSMTKALIIGGLSRDVSSIVSAVFGDAAEHDNARADYAKAQSKRLETMRRELAERVSDTIQHIEVSEAGEDTKEDSRFEPVEFGADGVAWAQLDEPSKVAFLESLENALLMPMAATISMSANELSLGKYLLSLAAKQQQDAS